MNPGFEDLTGCPSAPTVNRVPVDQSGTMPFWYNPAPYIYMPSGSPEATPDYMNSCISAVAATRITNYPPHNGQGHVAIIAQNSLLDDPQYAPQTERREYIQGVLCSPLEAGKQYRLSFWVRSDPDQITGTDGIGINVSEDKLVQGANAVPIVLTPAQALTTVHNPTGNIIISTTNWQQVSGIITANGGERWVTIGAFKPGYANYQYTNSGVGRPTYLVVDDIEVSPVIPDQYCDHTKWIENKPYYSPETETAGHFIYAGFNVGHPMPNGYVNVWPGNDVDYLAGKAIELLPGFTAMADQNSHFQGCILPNHCTTLEPAVADAGEDLFLPCHSPPFTIGNDCSEILYQWYADPPSAFSWLSDPTDCNPTVTIPASAYLAGIPAVQFMVASNAGPCDENYDAITIYLVPTPISADAGEDGVINAAPICNDHVNLGGPGTPGYTYSWSPTAGLNFPNYPNPQASYDAGLTYPVTYTLTVTSDDGCAIATDQVVVDYNPGQWCLLDISTGLVDGVPGTFSGQLDDQWKYVADDIGPITPEPMRIFHPAPGGYGDWVANGPNARWITPQGMDPPNNGGLPDNEGNELYEFERSFVIPNINQLMEMQLYIPSIAMDNSARFYVNDNNNGTEIPGNGTNLWIHPTHPNPVSNFQTLHSLSAISIDIADLQNGLNRLTFDMNNRRGIQLDTDPPIATSMMGLQMNGYLRYRSCSSCNIINPSTGGGGGGGVPRNAAINAAKIQSIYRLYPNPGPGKFVLEFGTLPDAGWTVTVRDLTGRVIGTRASIQEVQTQFDLSAQPAGVYLIEIDIAGKAYFERYVKQ